MRDFWISLPEWLQELLPIVILLAVIAGVMRTLPKVATERPSKRPLRFVTLPAWCRRIRPSVNISVWMP